jgi:tetratricopeptide (TPR) repeat protein
MLRITALFSILFSVAVSLAVAPVAQAKLTYLVGGKVCSRAEYRGAELAEEGHQLLTAGQYTAAADRLRKAATLSPNLCDVQNNLALALVKLGRAEEAIPYLKTAARMQHWSADSVRALTSAYVSSGRVIEATLVLEDFVRKNPDDPRVGEMSSYCAGLHKELLARSKCNQVESSSDKIDNYLAFANAEEGSVRWTSGRGPLKVFVASANGIKGYLPQFDGELHKALKAWEDASEGKVSFVGQNTREGADITLTWTDNLKDLDSPDEGGEARVKFGSTGVMHSDIYVLTHNDVSGRELTPSQMYGVCLHEIGHSLGLLNHSPDVHDIMYFSDRNSIQRPELSERDKNTLKLLYRTTEAFIPREGSANAIACRRSEMFNSAVRDYNSGRFDDAVSKCQSLIKQDPSFHDAAKLLADALDNAGAAMIEKSDYSTAERYIKQALDLRRSSATDVQDTLYNYVIVLRAQNRNSEADQIESQATAGRVVSSN